MVNLFEIKYTCIEFVIKNISPQCNVKIMLNLKAEEISEIAVLIFCGISENAPRFCLALSEAYLQLYETPNMKYFAKLVNGWIQSTIFAESLDISLGSEYVSDYLEALSIIIIWRSHFESSTNVSKLISILLKYLEQKFSP